MSNSSLSKTFALCQFRKIKLQQLCFLPLNIVLGLKKNESKNYFGSEKNWPKKNFGSKKIFGPKKFGPEIKVGSEKNLGTKKIGSEKILVAKFLLLFLFFL